MATPRKPRRRNNKTLNTRPWADWPEAMQVCVDLYLERFGDTTMGRRKVMQKFANELRTYLNAHLRKNRKGKREFLMWKVKPVGDQFWLWSRRYEIEPFRASVDFGEHILGANFNHDVSFQMGKARELAERRDVTIGEQFARNSAQAVYARLAPVLNDFVEHYECD